MTDERRLEIAVHSDKIDEPKATFQYLYIKYRPLVSFIAARYLRERADIDDVVQETFVNFFNHAKDVRTSVKSYLTATAKHLAFDLNKKNGKIVSMEEGDLPSEKSIESYSNGNFDAFIEDMKKVLSDEDIQIILLHLIEDLTFGEVAKEMGQNERTVKTKYYRALKKYRKERGDRQ